LNRRLRARALGHAGDGPLSTCEADPRGGRLPAGEAQRPTRAAQMQTREPSEPLSESSEAKVSRSSLVADDSRQRAPSS